MADVAPADVVAFVLRLVFLVLLYAVVAAMLLALRRSLNITAVSAASTRAARLTLLEASPIDGPVGRSVPLAGDVVIGRRAACDVVLRDDSVSGRHARVRRSGGQWELEDLGSTNGTLLNGQPLVGRAALRPGDVVGIGTARWQFEVAA